MPVLSFICRVLIGINCIQFLLSFFPKFEGTADSVGWIDSVLDGYRIDGFRIDFVWLVLSTLFIFFAGFEFRSRASVSRGAYIDTRLCFAWTLAFFVFVYHAIYVGVLDFG